MENIKMVVEGPLLFLQIDLTDNRGMGRKNIVVASTGGPYRIPGTEVWLNLYAYKKTTPK